MATVAARRAELSTALTTAGLKVAATWGGAPPYVCVFLNGTDFTSAGGETFRMGFRLTAVVGGALDRVAMAALDAAALAMYGAARGLAGWRLDSLSPVGTRIVADKELYSVDLIVSTSVEY